MLLLRNEDVKVRTNNKIIPTKSWGFSFYCGEGKVELPCLRETPKELQELLDDHHHESKIFRKNIRTFFKHMFIPIDHILQTHIHIRSINIHQTTRKI